jgi:hypothetical protein
MSRKVKARILVSTSKEPVDHTEILDEVQAANTAGALMASLEHTGVRLPDGVLAAIQRAMTTPTTEEKEIHISLFFRPHKESVRIAGGKLEVRE